jgi:hypothetical protein
LALLQAFADDSASDTGDRRLFMAGYLNRADRWALFADAWDEELRGAPSIDYLKMVEAQHLRGQFQGWAAETRDEKLRGLARVIRHFEPFSFQFSVSRERFDRLLQSVSPRGLGNPHFTCCFGIVASVARYAASQKSGLPIDFIFDEQSGVSADVQLFFGEMKKTLPRAARKLINGTPVFRDDKQFLPLQAADALVWHLRREHEVCVPPDTLPMANLLRCSSGHLMSEIDDATLESWAAHHSRLPGIDKLQTKSEWRNIKAVIARLSSIGFVPPHGNRWKNKAYTVRERIAKFFRN